MNTSTFQVDGGNNNIIGDSEVKQSSSPDMASDSSAGSMEDENINTNSNVEAVIIKSSCSSPVFVPSDSESDTDLDIPRKRARLTSIQSNHSDESLELIDIGVERRLLKASSSLVSSSNLLGLPGGNDPVFIDVSDEENDDVLIKREYLSPDRNSNSLAVNCNSNYPFIKQENLPSNYLVNSEDPPNTDASNPSPLVNLSFGSLSSIPPPFFETNRVIQVQVRMERFSDFKTLPDCQSCEGPRRCPKHRSPRSQTMIITGHFSFTNGGTFKCVLNEVLVRRLITSPNRTHYISSFRRNVGMCMLKPRYQLPFLLTVICRPQINFFILSID